MPKAITGERLVEAITKQTFMTGGKPESVEGIKYDFHMSARVLKARYGQPVNINDLPQNELVNMFVEPGEVVFVLTDEVLALPDNMIAQLVPKRKLSHEGIIVLGGFSVEPNYPGRLLVGLYNFSFTRFPLIPGKKLIAAIFYELEEDEKGKFPNFDSALNDFPDDVTKLIQNYKPIALQGLQETINETQRQLDSLRNEIVSGREWQQRFQTSLDRHDQQIEKLLRSLEEEKTNRAAADQSFRDQLTQLQLGTWKNAAKLSAIVAGVVLVISAFLQAVFPLIIQYFKSRSAP